MAEIFVDPAADVTLADVLLALGRLLSWLVVVALCAIIVAFVYAILWPLNKVVSGVTGGLIGSVPGTHAVESAVTSALGAAVSSFDKQVGSFWHGIKTIVSAVSEEILGLSIAFAYLQWWAANKLVKLVWHEVGRVIHAGTKAAEAEARQAERDATKAWKYSRAQTRRIEHQLEAIPRTVEGVLQPEITTARDLARAAEDEALKAWNFVKSKPWEVGATAFAGAVAIALSSLGLGWLRCPSNPFNKSKNACGLMGVLERVLGLAAFLTIAFDFEEFVKASDTVAGFIGDAVAGIEGTFETSLPPLPPPN